MTNRRSMFVRLRHRARDERGFTLLETVIAVTVMFGSLLALAYTATIGFGYQGLARQRQTANGLANQVMEQVRGLAYSKIQAGLLSTDLSGDANIVSCSGVNRFLSCSANPSIPGSAEKVVTSAGLATTEPLVPHRSSTSPNTNPVIDGITYQWSTYVTQNDAVTNAPYRVTVLVTWSGGALNAPNKLVRVQSLFWSPSGCRSASTHPFAAPCQAFFYGSTSAPRASVQIDGTIDQTTFSRGYLYGPLLTANAQREQIAQAQGEWQGTRVDITDGGGNRTAGGTTQSTNADSDPATIPGTYSRIRCPTEVSCATGSVDSTGGANSLVLTAPSATAESDSTTAASGANVCPPPPATAETDGLTCAGGRVQQTGDLTAVLNLNQAGSIGAASVAQVKAAGAATTAVVHRNVFPATNGCSPASAADGCFAMSMDRTVGTVNLGGLPSAFTPGTGWSGANAWNGYFLSIVGYRDTLTGSVGTSSPLPTGTIAGTIYYYNGSGYSSLSVSDAAVNGLNASYTTTQTISGTPYTLTVSTDTTGMTAGSTSLSPTSPSGDGTRTDVTARVTPPAVKVRYQLSGGGTSADLTLTVQLGALEANGSYSPAPAQGS